jgi:PAS domain S-box-containing protein
VGGSLSDNEVRAFCEDTDGRLWIGTYHGGIDLFHRETMSFSRPGNRPGLDRLNRLTVMSMAPDPSGDIWIGTFPGRMVRFDPDAGQISEVRLPAAPGLRNPGPVRALLVEDDGAVWAGTYGSGLYRRDPGDASLTRFGHLADDPQSLGHDEVWALLQDRSGTIWIGTNGGLCRHHRDSGSFTTFCHRPGDTTSLGSDRVRAIHEDRSGTIWVGTYGGGLNRFDRESETFTRIGTGSGLQSNVVYGITEDRLGRLWISTNQGLTRYDPATAAARTWHQHDGLQNNEFNAGAWLHTSEGEMLFGGISGFNIFRPEQIENNPHPPQVAFTGFRVFNSPVPPGPDAQGRTIIDREITEAPPVTLTHRDYVITIEFASLHFSAPEKNSYAYRMVGFEERWNHVGGRGHATYTNLPPGRYTFRVMAANKDGVWNREGISLAITILPPFWSTAWFRALAVLLLVVLVLAIHALRTRRIRERNRLLEEMNAKLNLQISERMRAEEARQESEERYRTLFEDSPLGVCHLDEKGCLLECNKKLVEILGHPRSALVGSRISDIIRDERLRTAVDQAITSSRIGFYEGQLSPRDPGLLIQVRAMFKRITLESGTFLGAMGVVEDITEGKRLESQLRQSQKMEAVGRLAGGVAHDFNNLLTVILGYTELLLSRLNAEDQSHRPVALIDSAGRRAASVTSQLLAFSRKQILKPEVLQLNDLITDMEKMLRPLLGESIQLVTSLSPAIWPMEADPGQIEQVLMNLIINARDAMADGGLLTIRTGSVTLEEPLNQNSFVIPAGDHVTLEVMDNGSGMSQDTRRRIFDPFFTTKEKGKGTGLGLSTVYGIIKQSGGYILVESEKGKGAVFRMYFPRSEGPAAEPEPVAPVGHSASNRSLSETILLVEDEDAVRNLLAETLEEQGYHLVTAADGERALDLAASMEGPLHLILTDVVMPGISGPELVEQLKPLHPTAAVLYMTGYTDEVIVQHGVLEPGVRLLNKPLNIHTLLAGVRQALDG